MPTSFNLLKNKFGDFTVAIYHLSTKHISRGSGRSAVAAAAYRSATRLKNYRDGVVHDFRRKKGVVHTEIILPTGSHSNWAKEREKLWNVAEATDERKNARTAREIEIALPVELTHPQRVKLVQEFSKHLADKYNVVVDIAIHKPEAEGADERNHHAHLLLTTRILQPDEKLGAKSNFEQSDKCLKNQNLPTGKEQVNQLRQAWEECTNEHLAKAGHEIKIDSRSHYERGLELVPTRHVGVHATQINRSGRSVYRKSLDFNEVDENSAIISNDPTQILNLIALEKSVFTKTDIMRYIRRYVDEDDFQKTFDQVMSSTELVILEKNQQSADKKISPRYTTRKTIEVESGIIQTAEKLRNLRHQHVKYKNVTKAIVQHHSKLPNIKLSTDQMRAIDYMVEKGQLKTVVGYAGAGKSTMLSVARNVWETNGSRVIGTALSGKATAGLEQSAGIKSQTIVSLLRNWKTGRNQLRKNDVLVVDEAGMINNSQLSKIMTEVEERGAKLVLVGDPGQLQSIGAGAGFRAIVNQIGGVELTEVRRQQKNWQRQATIDFAEQRTEYALNTYIHYQKVAHIDDMVDQKATYKALAGDYVFDPIKNQKSTKLGLAYEKKDVQQLNSAIRCLRREQGEINDDGIRVQTVNGVKEFATGDRVTLLKNDKKLGVQNGSLATIERINKKNLVIKLDDSGHSISIPINQYNFIDYGYATTIHKSQGATVDKTFVLASQLMDRSTTYVAMTRHRKDTQIFASMSKFKDTNEFRSSLSKSDLDETTHDFEHSFNLNRGIDINSSPNSKQEKKSQSQNISVEMENRSKRSREKSEIIEEENILKKSLKPSNSLPVPKQKLQEALDNYACVYEQICWSQSFGFETTPNQTDSLEMAEKKIEKLDPTTLKKLKSIEQETLESIVLEMSGEERVNILTESIENTSIKSNKITVKPIPSPTLKNDDENEYTYPAPSSRF